MHKKSYPLVDIMRIVSALLVIGIHTYPFLQISPPLDFFMTHIIGRIAVPFFFMTTAFFLFQHGFPTFKKLKATLYQLGFIYLICILIYIPIQIYNHTLIQSLSAIIQDIFVDGTFYHLWYLPASLIGIMIVYILQRYCSMKQSFVIVMILYIIGLGGDSYYYLITQIPIFKNLYDFIFQFCDYTRNGFFFAPIFIWLGAYIAQHHHKISRNHCYIAFFMSFLFMSIESILLNTYHLFKHDAMNIFLPLTMILLFMILISYSGKRYPLCKDLSLSLYIIHPMMIVVIRLIGKMVHLEVYMIDNNFIHFCLVTCLSLICSFLFISIKKGVSHHGKNQMSNRSQLG